MSGDLEDELDQLVALVPMAKTMEVLEEVATTLDVDVTTEVAAMSRRGVYRKVLNLLNSVEFETAADRAHKIQTCLATMSTHLGFSTLNKPPLEDAGEVVEQGAKVSEDKVEPVAKVAEKETEDESKVS